MIDASRQIEHLAIDDRRSRDIFLSTFLDQFLYNFTKLEKIKNYYTHISAGLFFV